jgi:hypothetical protein
MHWSAVQACSICTQAAPRKLAAGVGPVFPGVVTPADVMGPHYACTLRSVHWDHTGSAAAGVGRCDYIETGSAGVITMRLYWHSMWPQRAVFCWCKHRCTFAGHRRSAARP